MNTLESGSLITALLGGDTLTLMTSKAILSAKRIKDYMNNYRPISLLSIFNKILEKLVYNRLITFIENYNVLYDKQFGLRRNHSTVHVTLSIKNKIQRVEDGPAIFLWNCS